MSDGSPLTEQIEEALSAGDMLRIRRLTDGLDDATRARLRSALQDRTQKQTEEALRHARDLLFSPGTHTWSSESVPFGTKRRIEAARLLLVAIGNQGAVKKALPESRWSLLVSYDKEPEKRTAYQFAFALAQRTESWAPAMLAQIFDNSAPGLIDTRLQLRIGRDLVALSFADYETVVPLLSRAARRHYLGSLDWTDRFWAGVVWHALNATDEPSISESYFYEPIVNAMTVALDQGIFQREALLEVSLRRLSQVQKKAEGHWWDQFLDVLRPTTADWVRRVDQVFDLPASRTSRAQLRGLHALNELQKADAVDAITLIRSCAPALASESPPAAKEAVELIRRCAKADASARPLAFEVSLQALSHPKVAVAEAVLKWLERDTWWRSDPGLVSQLQAAGEEAPAGIGNRIKSLMPALPEDQPTGDVISDERKLALRVDEQLRRNAATASDDERDFLNACSAALNCQGPPPPPYRPDDELWRSDEPYRVPATPEETARLLLSHLGTQSPAVYEALLAGIRLPVTPGDAALVERMLRRLAPGGAQIDPSEWSWSLYRPHFRSLAPIVLGKELLNAALEAAERRDHRLPLSVPTHASGWLDPEVLAARSAKIDEWGDGELLELSSALFRLAPGDASRARAWRALASLDGLPPHVRAILAVACAPESEVQAAGEVYVQWVKDLDFKELDPRAYLAFRLFSATCRSRYPTSTPPFLDDAPRRERLLMPYPSSGHIHPGTFDFPAGAGRLLSQLLSKERIYGAGVEVLQEVLTTLGRPEHDLRPIRRDLAKVLAHPELIGIDLAGSLLLTGFRDGRFNSVEVASTVQEALTICDAPVARLLRTLNLLADQDGSFRDAAADGLERIVGDPAVSFTPTVRAAVLETLCSWRSAARRGIEHEAARTTLRNLAESRSASRARELARTLLKLEADPARPSAAEMLAARDVELVLRLSRLEKLSS